MNYKKFIWKLLPERTRLKLHIKSRENRKTLFPEFHQASSVIGYCLHTPLPTDEVLKILINKLRQEIWTTILSNPNNNMDTIEEMFYPGAITKFSWWTRLKIKLGLDFKKIK